MVATHEEIARLISQALAKQSDHPQQALLLADKAVRMAEESGESAVVARALTVQGGLLRLTGEYDAALLTLQRALETESTDLAQRASTHTQLGQLYLERGDSEKSKLQFERALTMQLTLQNTRGQAHAEFHLGSVAMFTSAHDEAIERYTSALELYSEVQDEEGMAAVLGSLGMLSQREARHQEALENLEQALELLTALGQDRNVGILKNQLAYSYAQLGQFEKAHSAVDDALQQAEWQQYASLKADAIYTKGTVHLAEGARDEALVAFHRALDLAVDLRMETLTEQIRRSMQDLLNTERE